MVKQPIAAKVDADVIDAIDGYVSALEDMGATRSNVVAAIVAAFCERASGNPDVVSQLRGRVIVMRRAWRSA